jgi:hypothetical protein
VPALMVVCKMGEDRALQHDASTHAEAGGCPASQPRNATRLAFQGSRPAVTEARTSPKRQADDEMTWIPLRQPCAVTENTRQLIACLEEPREPLLGVAAPRASSAHGSGEPVCAEPGCQSRGAGLKGWRGRVAGGVHPAGADGARHLRQRRDGVGQDGGLCPAAARAAAVPLAPRRDDLRAHPHADARTGGAGARLPSCFEVRSLFAG